MNIPENGDGGSRRVETLSRIHVDNAIFSQYVDVGPIHVTSNHIHSRICNSCYCTTFRSHLQKLSNLGLSFKVLFGLLVYFAISLSQSC